MNLLRILLHFLLPFACLSYSFGNEAYLKIVPNHPVEYHVKVDYEAKKMQAEGFVPDEKGGLAAHFTLTYSDKGTFPELVFVLNDFILQSETCCGIKFSYNSEETSEANLSGLYFMREYLHKEYALPLTKNLLILMEKSDRYPFLPIAKEDLLGYFEFVDWLRSLVNEGLPYHSADIFSIDLGPKNNPYHYTSLTQSISSENVEVAATIDFKDVYRDYYKNTHNWMAMASKLTMICDRKNALVREIKGLALLSQSTDIPRKKERAEPRIGDVEVSYCFSVTPQPLKK